MCPERHRLEVMSSLEGLTFAQIAGPLPARRVLANGLEVIVAHRPGIGLCTVQAWVRTGSIHEGRWEGSGISHYLEHMVFKGTGRFTNRELTEAIHRCGGSSNAYTTFDRTVYYVDAPQEGFDTAMEAIADMVFDPLITDADAKMEREVILREIAMGDDEHDQVLAKHVLEEAIRAHPFRQPVIGHRDLFIRVTADDLRAYHAGRYVPGNVVLAVGGGLPPETVFAAAERWFGRFPRRTLAELPATVEPPQGGLRRTDVVRPVSTTKGVACWRTPGHFDESRLAIDLFLGVLGAGNSSLLWSELREKRRLVHAIDASGFGIRECGLAWCGWAGDAAADCPTIERAIHEVVEGALQVGVTREQFEKVRRQAVVSMVNGQKSIHGLTGLFAHAAAVGHDLAWPQRSVERLAGLSADDLTRAARPWFRAEHLTHGTLRGAAVAACAVDQAAPNPPDQFEVLVLDNGVRVVLQPDPSIPKAGFGVFLAAGGAYEEDAKRGATGLLATMFSRDTARLDKDAVASRVDALGATFAEHATQISCGLWAEALSSDFLAIAELVTEGVLSPRVLPTTFEAEQAAAIAAGRDAEDDIVEKARLSLQRNFFAGHPLAIDACGTPTTLAQIAPADLLALHARLVVAGNLVVGVSGTFDREVALAFVRRCYGVLPRTPLAPAWLPTHLPAPAARHLEHASGEQAVVALAFPHCGFGPAEIAAANVTEELLSGMASGLFRRVREEKGMAYFVGATRVEVVDQGMFYLYAGTAPASAQEVLEEMRRELARLRAGKFNPEEIADARRRLGVSRRQGRQSAGARMQGALLREVAGLGANFDGEWERRMSVTDESAVQAFVRRYLDPKWEQELVVLPKA